MTFLRTVSFMCCLDGMVVSIAALFVPVRMTPGMSLLLILAGALGFAVARIEDRLKEL